MNFRHTNCQDYYCKRCLEDAHLLEQRLSEETKGNCKHALLGMYHRWLSDHGIKPETECGWFTKEAFDEENIINFTADFNLWDAGYEIP